MRVRSVWGQLEGVFPVPGAPAVTGVCPASAAAGWAGAGLIDEVSRPVVSAATAPVVVDGRDVEGGSVVPAGAVAACRGAGCSWAARYSARATICSICSGHDGRRRRKPSGARRSNPATVCQPARRRVWGARADRVAGRALLASMPRARASWTVSSRSARVSGVGAVRLRARYWVARRASSEPASAIGSPRAALSQSMNCSCPSGSRTICSSDRSPWVMQGCQPVLACCSAWAVRSARLWARPPSAGSSRAMLPAARVRASMSSATVRCTGCAMRASCSSPRRRPMSAKRPRSSWGMSAGCTSPCADSSCTARAVSLPSMSRLWPRCQGMTRKCRVAPTASGAVP